MHNRAKRSLHWHHSQVVYPGSMRQGLPGPNTMHAARQPIRQAVASLDVHIVGLRNGNTQGPIWYEQLSYWTGVHMPKA